MELKIKQEIKFLDSINKWCAGIQCFDQGFEIWTGGFFHKDRQKAIDQAMASFKQSLKFQQELKKPTEIKELVVTF